MAVESDTEEVVLATHGGLFGLGSGTAEKIGPAIDLMGFAPAGNDHYFASGHPRHDERVVLPHRRSRIFPYATTEIREHSVEPHQADAGRLTSDSTKRWYECFCAADGAGMLVV